MGRPREVKQHQITPEMMERWRDIYMDAQIDRKSYQCPICKHWVIWPDSHAHREGELVD